MYKIIKQKNEIKNEYRKGCIIYKSQTEFMGYDKNKSYLLKFNSIKMILQLTLKVYVRNIQLY